MSRIIDAKGKACPMPVLMAKEAISAGESQFTVLVDNTTAVGTRVLTPRWRRRTGLTACPF